MIRPHALGHFEDLLMATAKSPAMLFYLDNWLSVAPQAAERLEQRRKQAGGRMRKGLNENYARELLELHTLGVDGGYTQQDVTELARVLTGWTLRGIRQGELRFFFDRRMHDPGDKQLLGEPVRGGGIEEGEAVIRRLARHSSTARFVTAKLVKRFVADEPPAALVERASRTFTETGGDIREVLRTILASPEFYAPRPPYDEVQDPLRVRRQRRPSHVRRCTGRPPAGPHRRRDGNAPLPQPPPHRLRRRSGRLGSRPTRSFRG